MWWSRPGDIARLALRRAAEFAAPNHQRAVEQAALLQIANQSGRRAVDFAATIVERLPQVRSRVAVMVPIGVVKLHEAAALFDEPPCQQAVASERRLGSGSTP